MKKKKNEQVKSLGKPLASYSTQGDFKRAWLRFQEDGPYRFLEGQTLECSWPMRVSVILRVLDQTGDGHKCPGRCGFSGFRTDIHTEPSTWEPPRPGLMLHSGCLEMLNHLPLTLWSVSGYVHPPFCCSCEYSDHHVHEHRTPVDSWCGGGGSERLQVIPGSLCFISDSEEKGTEAPNPTGPRFPFKPKLP